MLAILKKINRWDVMHLFLVSILIIGLTWRLYFVEQTGKKYVLIQTDSQKFYYTLDEERLVTIEGPLGSTQILIEKERVRILRSPCRKKLGILMGSVSQWNAWLACLPNRIFIRIISLDKESPDIDVLV